MKKLIFPLLLSAAAFASLAQAADWRVLIKDSKGELAVDVDSIKTMGTMREVWAMRNFAEAQQTNDKDFPTVNSYQDQYVLNCDDKTLRLAREVIYAEPNGKGDKRDQSDALANMPYNKPDPNTVVETLVNEVCAYKPAKKSDDTDKKATSPKKKSAK
jgi:hypothetical protein